MKNATSQMHKQAHKQALRNIQDLYSLAGSATKLAAALDLHAVTVENWRKCGPPRKYWDKLFILYGVTPAELHSLCKTCVYYTTRPKPKRNL